MKLIAAEKRKVKRLTHWLVAHSNCVGMLADFKPGSVNHAVVERERKKIWNRLMKADTRLLSIAGSDLDARELSGGRRGIPL